MTYGEKTYSAVSCKEFIFLKLLVIEDGVKTSNEFNAYRLGKFSASARGVWNKNC